MAKDKSNIFVDSNVLVALYRLDDALHQKAVELSVELDKYKPTYVTNNYCINEALTILLLRTKSLEASIKLGQMVYEGLNPWFRLLQVDKDAQRQAWDFFQQQKPTDQISFTDCTIIVHMKNQNIKQILTFDTHLEKFISSNLKL